VNAFEMAAALRSQPSPEVEAKQPTAPRQHVIWRVVTHSDAVKERLVEIVNDFNDARYGDIKETNFADRKHLGAEVSEEMIRALCKSADPDFVVLSKQGKNFSWSYSKKYSRGDLTKYLGPKFAKVYQTKAITL
jgi:hypothetical protein